MCSPEVLHLVHEKVADRTSFTRRQAIGLSTAMIAGVVLPGAAAAQSATPVGIAVSTPSISDISVSAVVDLTHTLTPQTPVWPGNEPFAHEVVRSYGEHGFYAQALSVWEHTGTHLDAPAHFIEGAETAEFLPVANLVAPLVVIDISARAAEDPDASVTPDDVDAWEQEHGEIPAGAFVAMHSGWAQFIGDAERFTNTDANGVMHFLVSTPMRRNCLLNSDPSLAWGRIHSVSTPGTRPILARISPFLAPGSTVWRGWRVLTRYRRAARRSSLARRSIRTPPAALRACWRLSDAGSSM